MERRKPSLLWIICLSVAFFLGGSPAWAHDKSAHHAPSTTGKVREIAGNTLLLSTDHGTLSVELSPETKILRDGAPSSQAELKVGEVIELEGPKLPGGGVAAREIWVHSGAKPQKEDR